MRFVQQTFEDESVEVDGNEYEECIFIRCRIVFSGAAPVSYIACTFDSCNWVFDGAAEVTLQYLSKLYNGIRPDGPNLVDKIFDSVRNGTLNGTRQPEPALLR